MVMRLRTKGLEKNMRRCFQTSERSCQAVMENAKFCNEGFTQPQQQKIFIKFESLHLVPPVQKTLIEQKYFFPKC